MIADSEKHDNRDQVGKVRHDLHDVEYRVQHRLHGFALECPETEYEAEQDRHRCGDQDEGQGFHRRFPLSEYRDVYKGKPDKQRQPETAQGMAQNRGTTGNHGPWQCRPARPLVFGRPVPTAEGDNGLDATEKDFAHKFNHEQN